MTYLAALLGHVSVCLISTSERARIAWAYLWGTRAMPVTELRQILTQGDRDWLDQTAAHLDILRPTGARLPGGFGAPVLEYDR